MVLPDHRSQAFLLTEGIGQFTSTELKIIHQVENPLQSLREGELNTANNVIAVNPGIDVGSVLGDKVAGGTSDEGGDVLSGPINPTETKHAGLNDVGVQAQNTAFRLQQQRIDWGVFIRGCLLMADRTALIAIDAGTAEVGDVKRALPPALLHRLNQIGNA